MLRRLSLLVTLVIVYLSLLSQAQIFPESSQDPLSGSSLGTSAFVPPVTFTPITTFASAETRVVTTVIGVGPSLTTNTYTYVYSRPLSTILGTDLAEVYSSIAANGSPTAATGALQPNPTDLQIVGGSSAASPSLSKELSMTLVMLLGMVAGMGVILV